MIKPILDECIRQNEALASLIRQPIPDADGIDESLHRLLDALQRTNYPVALQGRFISLLQLTDAPDVYHQYTLEDIRRLLQSQLSLQPRNLDTYLEASFFEWAVMDDANRARTLLTEGVCQARHVLSALEELQQQIGADPSL